jgi:hypothetical protein
LDEHSVDVNDKGGAHVHGAVNDKVNAHDRASHEPTMASDATARTWGRAHLESI